MFHAYCAAAVFLFRGDKVLKKEQKVQILKESFHSYKIFEARLFEKRNQSKTFRDNPRRVDLFFTLSLSCFATKNKLIFFVS